MDHDGLSKGSWMPQESAMPRSHLQPTTAREGLGSTLLLWHGVCREECSAMKNDGQRTFWAGTPLLRDSVYANRSVELSGLLPELSYMDPTKVVIDLPKSVLNRC